MKELPASIPRWYSWLIPLLIVAVILAGVLAVRANLEASESACKAVNQTKVVVLAVLKKTAELTNPAAATPGTPQAVLDIREKSYRDFIRLYNDVKHKELAATSC